MNPVAFVWCVTMDSVDCYSLNLQPNQNFKSTKKNIMKYGYELQAVDPQFNDVNRSPWIFVIFVEKICL